jgi:hypothetical protein
MRRVGSAGGDANQLLVGVGGNSRGRKMTLLQSIDANLEKQEMGYRVRLRWLRRRCRRDQDFAAAFEEELAAKLGISAIDWSKIDWEKVMKIVMMIIEAWLG